LCWSGPCWEGWKRRNEGAQGWELEILLCQRSEDHHAKRALPSCTWEVCAVSTHYHLSYVFYSSGTSAFSDWVFDGIKSVNKQKMLAGYIQTCCGCCPRAQPIVAEAAKTCRPHLVSGLISMTQSTFSWPGHENVGWLWVRVISALILLCTPSHWVKLLSSQHMGLVCLENLCLSYI